ncbi:hypothetical protein B7G54_11990 [Burkholderia puraquae]|uniref:Uncharacterized protein n=1 Tax=Burkholderia puraquae TaxID=1904757 RepID=A0A1X1PJ18_9BURK|nr:hypothetical protein [Burkholderia puraquae]ORT86194.1 hypothetical protein B7G54_11990 [Burkholderia puraquae]CAB3754537.1 hypothetical protein LMG29660_02334 [Burkholderia puraquae]
MRADSQVYDLGDGLSATGNGVAIRGGYYTFLADGIAGGATISLQIQHPDGTWCDVGALAGNAPVKTTTLPFTVSPVVLPACIVRAAITSGVGVSVNASLAGIG